jgi:hypothetical protein
MNFQVDGKASLAQQEIQLQTLETFFVEVIDYNAGADVKNDLTLKNIPGPVASPIHLAAIVAPDGLAQLAAKEPTIVFDRTVFVEGQKKRVVGYRAAH